MKQSRLSCKTKKKFKATTDSKHYNPVVPNILNRKFTVAKPNHVRVAEITYIWTAKGCLYLATVIDLFSRRIIDWSMGNRMTIELVNDALLAAI